jgi:hypothetical protein
MLREGEVIRFHGETTSLFHTSRHEYANLVKCAPFILGSTIRGAVLKWLIETNCPLGKLADLQGTDDPQRIASIHRECQEPCVVKDFFTEPPRVWFSFASFDRDISEEYSSVTRIAISRDTGSVAEGGIFNIEAVNPGVGFRFEIILFDEALAAKVAVISAIEGIGEFAGLGGYRSLGFGTFRAAVEQELDFAERVEEEILAQPVFDDRLEIRFVTPFVLSDGMEPQPLNSQAMAEMLSREIRQSNLTGIEEEVAPLPINRVDVRLKPDFVGRFSYERGLRENRLVAWPDSSLILYLDESAENASEQVAVAAVLGIGEWKEWGFGRFHVAEEL